MKTRLFRTLAAFALLPLSWAGQTRGCGLDWMLPRNHFEGVTSQGNVSYWEKIGEVDCGEDLVLPLHINFNSHRDGGAPSPYLGEGWMLPLLESKFVQESEDRFDMIQPDGLNNLFVRATPGGKDSVLNGSSGWRGEIKGDTITAWASCGWKLVFTNGHITSMTTAKGRRFDWVYDGGKVSELREGNSTRLKVEYGTDGRVQALTLPARGRIFVAQDKKPHIQAAAGQSFIAGVNYSLAHLTLLDGSARSYSYGTNEHTQPTLVIDNKAPGIDGNERKFVWDPATRLILSDGDIAYRIKPSSNPLITAIIERSNGLGQRESWYLNREAGVEEVTTINGIKRTTISFVSGAARGRVRRIEEMYNGNKQIVFQAWYDDKGAIIREHEVSNGSVIDSQKSGDDFTVAVKSPQGARFMYKLDARTNRFDIENATPTSHN